VRPATINVEVVLALPERQSLHRVQLPAGSTVEAALAASGMTGMPADRVGIYGKVVPAGTVLNDGDRVEIYRPLAADPKVLRQARARRKRAER
jgi:putative ubiquitin-RnfH superfamily antitoxin RatB of RatAB toxin-antitoxin module